MIYHVCTLHGLGLGTLSAWRSAFYPWPPTEVSYANTNPTIAFVQVMS